MKRKTIRVVVAVLCLALCVTFMPVLAFAGSGSGQGGSGQSGDYSITWNDGKTTFEEYYYDITPDYPWQYEMGDKLTVTGQGKTVTFSYKFNNFYDKNWKAIEEYGYSLSNAWKEQYDFYGADDPFDHIGGKYVFYRFLYKVNSDGKPLDAAGNVVDYPTDAEILGISKPVTVISILDNIHRTIDGATYYVYRNQKTANIVDFIPAKINGSLKIPKKIKINGKYYPVTSIDANCFSGCKNLTSVDLPNTLIHLVDKAFLNTGLKRIAIPDSVKDIRDFAVGYTAHVDKKTGDTVFKKVPGFVIYATSGSVASDYAYENGFKLITQKDAKKMKTKVRAKALKGKKVRLNWKKKKYASGYQIYLAKSKKAKKKGKFKKVATIKTPNTVKWTGKKLSKKLKGKRIYYKVRTYTKVGSKNYYGKWSKVVSVKVKK